MSTMTEFNNKVIEEFRANCGKVGGQFAAAPIVLLTTKGAKSGRPYIHPLVYLKDGDRYVVIASFAGAPKHPSWYHNIVANPTVTLEIGSKKFEARAKITSGEERERLYNAQAALMPFFNDYRKKTSRQIPVVALTRI
jgi:deazaflavin-dependent oxidoreductase (nitroreductase family)